MLPPDACPFASAGAAPAVLPFMAYTAIEPKGKPSLNSVEAESAQSKGRNRNAGDCERNYAEADGDPSVRGSCEPAKARNTQRGSSHRWQRAKTETGHHDSAAQRASR